MSVEKKTLELGVGWVGAGAVCAECERACARHDFSTERRGRHLDAMGFETQVVARTPTLCFSDHWLLQMKWPWAGKHSRFTRL